MVITGCTDHYELGEYGEYSGDVRQLPVSSFSAVLHGTDADAVPVDHQHPPDDGGVEKCDAGCSCQYWSCHTRSVVGG